MLQPRLAAVIGYVALAGTLCVSDRTHLPQTAYVVAFAIGYGMARFGPDAAEGLRGCGFRRPAAVFGVLVAASLAVEAVTLVLTAANLAPREIDAIAHVALTLVYAYVWEIAYDLGGPKRRLLRRGPGDVVRRLAARIAAIHGTPVPIRVGA